MERRRFISIAGGAGLGILLPYAVYRSLAYGFGAANVDVKGYEKFGKVSLSCTNLTMFIPSGPVIRGRRGRRVSVAYTSPNVRSAQKSSFPASRNSLVLEAC